MVQEKDAAKKRVAERAEFVRRETERLNAEIVDTRWYVYEHTPEVPYDGGWDRGTPAKNRRVSSHFRTREGAEEWMSRHEPDKGNFLRIGKQNKRRKVTIGWYDY